MRHNHLDSAMLECLTSVQRLLGRFPDRGVVIGGIAVGLLAQPRATQDVDVILLINLEEVPLLIETAGEFGLTPRIADPIPFARRSRVVLFRHERTGITVDISLGVLPFETEMVKRAVSYQGSGFSVPLARPEDLIVLKAVAHRSQDLADIQAIAESNPALDRKYIEKWVRQFADALDMPEIWEDIAHWFDEPLADRKGAE